MALTAQPPAPPTWGRWHQHQPNSDYSLMDPSGLMHYDSRPMTCPPLQRPPMSPQYVVGSSYSMAPMSSVAAPHYPQQASYASYSPYGGSQAPTPPQFKQPYQERPNLRIQASEPDSVRAISYPRDSRNAYEAHSPNPSIKSESQLSIKSTSSHNPSVAAKNISCNVSVNPQHQVNFVTDVDTLMRAIQAKHETEVIVKKAEMEHQAMQSPVATPEVQTPIQPQQSRQNRKRYTCDVSGCAKTFYQKTHLDIHRRAHTGDKPYTCKQPGCGQRFSQLGNLKTHERRHTGERPYECDQCGKRFAQRGNVRAHRIVHLQAKPYICKLDDCNKQFTQLGNLKSHQNKFHANALKNLTSKFATITDTSKVSEADRDLWEYFATLYKNSNKGIKGRGKDRKVGAVSQSPTGSATSQHPTPHAPTPVRPHHHSPIHGLNHPGSLAAYGVTRSNGPGPNMIVSVGNLPSSARDAQGGYDMFEMDDDHSSGAPSSSSGTIYEEDHGRSLSFSERMYG